MTCRFVRLTIKGTDETKLNTIKNWFETKIDNADLVQEHSLGVYQELDSEEYTLNCDMYIKYAVGSKKYLDIIKNKFKTYDKEGLTKASLEVYNECTHDTDNPQPCVIIKDYEWSNE